MISGRYIAKGVAALGLVVTVGGGIHYCSRVQDVETNERVLTVKKDLHNAETNLFACKGDTELSDVVRIYHSETPDLTKSVAECKPYEDKVSELKREQESVDALSQGVVSQYHNNQFKLLASLIGGLTAFSGGLISLLYGPSDRKKLP